MRSRHNQRGGAPRRTPLHVVSSAVRRLRDPELIAAAQGADVRSMSSINPVGVQIQAMMLESTREHMARAATEAAATAPAQTTDTSAVILELSAAAQQLIAPRPFAST
jgi:hypothetical protein